MGGVATVTALFCIGGERHRASPKPPHYIDHSRRRDHWSARYFRGRPRRPQGRMIRTAAMRAKTEKIEKRGKKRMPKESTCP